MPTGRLNTCRGVQPESGLCAEGRYDEQDRVRAGGAGRGGQGYV